MRKCCQTFSRHLSNGSIRNGWRAQAVARHFERTREYEMYDVNQIAIAAAILYDTNPAYERCMKTNERRKKILSVLAACVVCVILYQHTRKKSLFGFGRILSSYFFCWILFRFATNILLFTQTWNIQWNWKIAQSVLCPNKIWNEKCVAEEKKRIEYTVRAAERPV